MIGAEAKATFARRSLDTTTRVLVEMRLPDGRWAGHAEDHGAVGSRPDPAIAATSRMRS